MALGATQLADVSYQVKTFWSDLFKDELLESAVLPALVNREYEGEIKDEGNTVRVSQINRPEASIRQVGSNEDAFTASKMSLDYVDVVANQVITAAFEFNSIAMLQSQLKSKDSKIRQALIEAAMIKLNSYLYSLVSPSTSSPDHSVASVSDFNAAALLSNRLLASQAKWPDANRYCLVDPSYYNDLLSAQTLTSSDYVGADAPVVAGKMLKQRFGFWIVEDNSAGMSQLSPTAATSDLALLFHPDFMYLVMGQPEFEVSSLHSQKRHGFLMSVKLIVGAKLGIDGSVKHIVNYNS